MKEMNDKTYNDQLGQIEKLQKETFKRVRREAPAGVSDEYLQQRVVTYMVPKMIQIIANQESNLFLKDSFFLKWMQEETLYNGVIAMDEQGIFPIYKFKKEVELADFNPPMNNTVQYSAHVSKRLYTSVPIYDEQMFELATNPAKFARWFNKYLSATLKSIRIRMEYEKWALITQETISPINMKGYKNITPAVTFDYDQILYGNIDTPANTTKLISDIKSMLFDFTALSLHTKMSKLPGNESMIESYDLSELTLLIDKKFFIKKSELLAKLYNETQIDLKMQVKVVPFEKQLGPDGNKVKDVFAYIIHNKALFLGFSIKNLKEIIKTFGMKTIARTHYWFGAGRRQGAPIVKVMKTPTTPPTGDGN